MNRNILKVHRKIPREILDANHQRQHVESDKDSNNKSVWVNYLLWHDEVSHPEDKNPTTVKPLLQGIIYDSPIYDPSDRILEVVVPPKNLSKKLEGLSHQTFTDFAVRFRRPIAEVVYTGLRSPVVDGEPALCIPRQESRNLGATLSRLGFDVLAYDQRVNDLIILYATPMIAEHIRVSISNTESDLAQLKKYLNDSTRI